MKNTMKNTVLAIAVSLATIWLRFVNLGYSHYQGDEIKALYRPHGQGLVDFLLSQKKGPIQFLVTYVLRIVDPSYQHEFLVRFPFAIAGVLAVYFFYKLVELHAGKRPALYASFFLATNGLFVAFSRIVQYQSYVILFSLLTLYFLSLSLKHKVWRVYGLYAAMICWAFSILAHYDGIFIAPYVVYLLYRWYCDPSPDTLRADRNKHLMASLMVCAVMVAIFYVPFIGMISETKLDYWVIRIKGTRQSASLRTFKTYNPTVVIYFYAILGGISLFRMKKIFPIVLWFLFPFVCLQFFISQPRTHIYTYILPLCMMLGYGMQVVEDWWNQIFSSKNMSVIQNTIIGILFGFLFFLSHSVFVDHNQEYPWDKERFLVWTLPQNYIHGLFGFPYNRHWKEIGEYLYPINAHIDYVTNDTAEIAEFYLPENFRRFQHFHLNNTPLPENVFVINIINSQRPGRSMLGKEADYFESRYEPIKTFSRDGRETAKIYRLSHEELAKLADNSNG